MARVTVMQQFHNPFAEKIEAIYVFPLDENSAVDDMEMKIGERLIKGQIKERSEAAKLYQNAKQQGHVASLLDQERPNIFTQSVANIEPGQGITITIHYSVTLTWKDGSYHFHLPTVIGPRYIPGARLPEKDKATMPSFSRSQEKRPLPVKSRSIQTHRLHPRRRCRMRIASRLPLPSKAIAPGTILPSR